MVGPDCYASFLVRLWRDTTRIEGNAAEPVWVGEVVVIQTGQTIPFTGLEALLILLKAYTNAE